MIDIQHECVRLRGGELDGMTPCFAPSELGVELRITTVDRYSNPPQICEHFYMIVGVYNVEPKYQGMLVAEHVNTTRYDIASIDPPTEEAAQ